MALFVFNILEMDNIRFLAIEWRDCTYDMMKWNKGNLEREIAECDLSIDEINTALNEACIDWFVNDNKILTRIKGK